MGPVYVVLSSNLIRANLIQGPTEAIRPCLYVALSSNLIQSPIIRR